MRTLTTFAKEKSLILLFAATIFLFSCDPQSGGASGNGPIVPNTPPPVLIKPIVNAENPDTSWFGDDISGSFSVTGKYDRITASAIPGAISVEGNSYKVTSVTQQTKVTIVAYNGTETGQKEVTLNVYSQRKTYLCRGSKLWKPYRVEIDGVLINPATTIVYGYSYIFYKNDKVQIYLPGTSTVPPLAPYYFGPGDQTITFGGTTQTIDTMSSSEIVLRYTNYSNQLVVTTLR